MIFLLKMFLKNNEMNKDIHKDFLEKIRELEYNFYSIDISQLEDHFIEENEIDSFQDYINKYKMIKRLEFFIEFLDFIEKNFNEIYSLKIEKNPLYNILKIFEYKLELFLKTINNFPYFCFDNEKKKLDRLKYKMIDFQNKIQKQKEKKQILYLSIFYKGEKTEMINFRDVTEMIHEFII